METNNLFISSTLMNMYFGESQKLIRALFSMCRKLSPCILFIDEVDIFLKSRDSGAQEVRMEVLYELGQFPNEVRILAIVGWYAFRRL